RAPGGLRQDSDLWLVIRRSLEAEPLDRNELSVEVGRRELPLFLRIGGCHRSALRPCRDRLTAALLAQLNTSISRLFCDVKPGVEQGNRSGERHAALGSEQNIKSRFGSIRRSWIFMHRCARSEEHTSEL